MADIVDPDDPAAVREAYAIETTWDDDAQAYRVTAETTTIESHVMGIISNRGQWPNEDLYTDYVNTLLGIHDTPMELSGPSQCDVVPNVIMSFSGDYARWDRENSQWAGKQRSNLLLDAISGPKLGVQPRRPTHRFWYLDPTLRTKFERPTLQNAMFYRVQRNDQQGSRTL
ncbi:MAG: hypothetical protein ABEN55_10240 [Bradymonadaceae bacterium]